MKTNLKTLRALEVEPSLINVRVTGIHDLDIFQTASGVLWVWKKLGFKGKVKDINIKSFEE